MLVFVYIIIFCSTISIVIFILFSKKNAYNIIYRIVKNPTYIILYIPYFRHFDRLFGARVLFYSPYMISWLPLIKNWAIYAKNKNKFGVGKFSAGVECL